MPFSAVRNADDAEDLFRNSWLPNCEYVVTEKGAFSGSVTRIRLHQLQMQQISEFPRAVVARL